MSAGRASYQVLGLAGQQGAGKDWTYDALVNLYDGKRRVRRMAFADGVRREVSREVITALGIGIEQDDGMGIWVKPYTSGQRFLLQQWGTEFRRAQDPGYWVKYGVKYIDERAQDGDLWVITDVRFANEAESIRDHNGKVALVQADAETRAARLGLTEADLSKRSQHASEVIDFNADFVVSNMPNVMLDAYLLRWLGLDPQCFKCAFAQPHYWHDNGEAFSGA